MSTANTDTTPKKKRTPKKLPKIMARDDVSKILAVPNTACKIGLRNRAILQTMYRAGLRVSEICNIMLEDVDLQDGYILIQLGKGSKDRVVPIGPETIEWFKKWLQVRPQGTDYFFPTLQKTALNERYVREMVYRTAKKAGAYIRDGKNKKLPSPHTFRHCSLTEMLEDGLNLREVQEIAGHSNIQTTSVYLSVRPEALAAKIRARESVAAENS